MLRFPLWFLAVALWWGLGPNSAAQGSLNERVARLERELALERERNDRHQAQALAQKQRIRELELTCVSLRETIDVVQSEPQLEEAVQSLIDRQLAKSRLSPSAAGPSWSVRGRSRLAFRSFGGHSISNDQSIEVEHFILSIDIPLGESSSVHLAPGLSHSGAFFLIAGYVESEVSDWLSLRAGRFLIPFGGIHAWAFPSDTFIEPFLGDNNPRPFMYAPYWDEGLMAKGRIALDEAAGIHLSYSAYLVNGYDTIGLEGIHKRSLGDNNENKTVGGRIAIDLPLSEDVDLSVGSSFTTGKHDADDRLSFFAIGGDLELRAGPFSLYMEIFHRPREIEAKVAENPAATLREVSRLTGIKLRPRYQFNDDLAIYAQADWLRVRQPPRNAGQFSVFHLDDESFTIRSYLFGIEYALRERVLLNLEFGYFDRDRDLGADIPYFSASITTSF